MNLDHYYKLIYINTLYTNYKHVTFEDFLKEMFTPGSYYKNILFQEHLHSLSSVK